MIIQPYMPHRDNGVTSERQLEAMLSALPGNFDAFAGIVESGVDWKALLDTASLHGVEDFIFRQAGKAEVVFPREVAQEVTSRRACKVAWMMHLQTLLGRTLDALDEHGVPSVLIKGPMLGERLYGDPTFRSSTDLDVLVKYNDLTRAIAALRDIGYNADDHTIAEALRGDHNVAMTSATPPVIEVHFHLFRRFGTTLLSDDFMSRSRSYVTKHGRTVSVLSPEDEFLFLCVHLAAHHFVRLAWLFDLKLYLERHPEFDWDVLMNRARSLKLVSSVVFACEILRQRLGIETPIFDLLNGRQRARLSVNRYLFDRNMRQHNAPTAVTMRRKLSFLVTSNVYTASLHDRFTSAMWFLGNNLWQRINGRIPDPGDA